MSLNKVMLIGCLGRDPEIKYTQAGKAVAKFSLATHEGKDKDGSQKTEWHNIVAWEKLAEICQQYLKKGSLVFIEGRLAKREWKDKKGQEQTSTEIVAGQMRMLDRKPETAKAGTAENGAPDTDDESPV